MEVIIGIGIPASGKTTLLKQLAAQKNMDYTNADDIRYTLIGNERDHSAELLVWETVYSEIRTSLQARRSVVIDATHSKRTDRKTVLAFCRKYGAKEILGYYIDTPLETCLRRNALRKQPVPEAVIIKMHNQLQDAPPSVDEGFTRIEIFREG
jgi:predicted kinase